MHIGVLFCCSDEDAQEIDAAEYLNYYSLSNSQCLNTTFIGRVSYEELFNKIFPKNKTLDKASKRLALEVMSEDQIEHSFKNVNEWNDFFNNKLKEQNISYNQILESCEIIDDGNFTIKKTDDYVECSLPLEYVDRFTYWDYGRPVDSWGFYPNEDGRKKYVFKNNKIVKRTFTIENILKAFDYIVIDFDEDQMYGNAIISTVKDKVELKEIIDKILHSKKYFVGDVHT